MTRSNPDPLDTALRTIEKQFGPGSIMCLGDDPRPPGSQNDVISTGCLSLDLALGIGGVPAGRVVEVYGPESSGKTTLSLQLVAQSQKNGGHAAFIDAEHALDIAYARALGVHPDRLLVSQPDCAEHALEIVDILVRSGAVPLIVVDSVAALVPRAEIEGEMGDAHVGLQARLMSQALRKLTSAMSRHRTTVIFVNQIRMKIGVVFGNPETTPGGNALKFFSSVRMEIRRIGPLKDGTSVVGNRARIKVVKNKLAPPFATTEVDILFGRGICPFGDLLDLAVDQGLIQKSGSWFSYQGEQLGQGRERAREALRENPALFQALRQTILRRAHLLPEEDEPVAMAS